MTAAMETGSSNRAPIDRLLRPRSIAIVGASPAATSFGASVLMNLQNAKFNGDLYLINPKRSEIHGRPCLPSIDALPPGVDCAVLAIPRSSVLEAVAACARQSVGGVIVFSSGFAESGPQGRAEQEEIAAIAKKHCMIVEGPNCLGMVNFIDGIPLTFVLTPPAVYDGDNGVAVISQSGAMAAVVGVGLRHRELGVSFSVSTGNEAVSFVEDFVEYLIEDSHTRVLLMIVEKFRRPQRFLELAAHARKLGKFIVLIHPGRSSAARASAETHTGALAGDYQVMHTKVTHAGVVVVETLEELLDVSEMLLRFPSLPPGGTAVLTESGAFKALSLDFCDQVGLPLPGLSEATSAALRNVLPDFILPTNPLDLTAQGLVDPDLYRRTLPLILADELFGSLVLAIILTDEPTSGLKFQPIIDAIREARPSKPIVFAGLDEGAKILPEYVEELRALGVPFFPTPERAFRALARVTMFASAEARLGSKKAKQPGTQGLRVSSLGSGVIPEYKSKEVLHALRIRIPEGTLARTEAEATIAAAHLGYPVVLKAQSAQLSHKSDVGGVALNLNDEDQLGAAWLRIQNSVSRVYPELVLDGILVEKMSAPGIELIVGVRNDPDWGPVLLIGVGGVFAEALNDVRLIPPDLPVEVIVEEILQLKCAALLSGFRGSRAIDVKAVADVVHRLGAFALANPQIKEVDINPLVAYANEGGAVALDALIVTQ
jgi:acetate---CoA ligase (ADP-forming)